MACGGGHTLSLSEAVTELKVRPSPDRGRGREGGREGEREQRGKETRRRGRKEKKGGGVREREREREEGGRERGGERGAGRCGKVLYTQRTCAHVERQYWRVNMYM